MNRERETQGGERDKPETNTAKPELTGAAYTELPNKADGMTKAEEFTNQASGERTK
ncbi:hypothetical protein [Paenibacillus sp.]|uniref:hypothetical protein n=1 Tax=Paenibacillus sp. TaxID=58172 RepID=UPI002D57743A|nr:hypothetical protein [Paenibacillus sp.]HZG86554.1 hypothetical protein [Paenibacillus sp.]